MGTDGENKYIISGRPFRLRNNLTLRETKELERLELTAETFTDQYEKFLNIVLEPLDGSAAPDYLDITENEIDRVLIDFIEQKKNRQRRIMQHLQK